MGGENILRKSSADDMVVLVMGITGVGKSTFISKLIGEDIGIGHDLTSYTKGVGIHSMALEDRLVYLIDTPGFNDTWRSDTEILKEISFILSQIYRKGMKLAGILYLHRISDNRVSGSTMKNIDLLEKMCGREALSRVFLVTTMWEWTQNGRLSHQEATTREFKLAATSEFWGRLCEHGSQVRRWPGDRQSAYSLIKELAALNDRRGLVTQIQRELVDEGKSLIDTAAGRELSKGYTRNEQKCVAELESLRQYDSYDTGLRSGLSELQNEIREMHYAQGELQVSIQSILAEREQVYDQILAQMQADIQQLSAENEVGRRKCLNLEAEMQENALLMEEQQREWERQRLALAREAQARRRRSQSIEREYYRIEQEEQDFKHQIEEVEKDNEEEYMEAGERVEKTRKREILKRNLIPFLGILGGTGLTIAGAVTGMIPLIGAGVGIGFSGASSLQLSRKNKEKAGRETWPAHGALGASTDYLLGNNSSNSTHT
ncbi:P-loop containing nucleoside triphosphate hydrolase protein [Aspergillus karnatakaensis]|uniref:P-loop containing nucleoside triphosphate hydrolase protein n=1 Tax=Aspergillus karnatakaensis TaxID=1810916 RepID=UPI003CCDDB1D